MSDGFLMLRRTEVTDTLLADMPALHLLTVIGLRARYSAAPSVHGLTFGQAMIGDWEKIGMTEKEYRCAKQRLAAFGLASFKGKSRGTVATLLDQRVFNLGDDRKEAKQGDQKGDQKSDHFSEVKTEEQANEGRAQGRTRGELGATNNKGIRKEPILAPNGASELFGIPAQPIARVSKPRPASSPFVIPTGEEVTAYALEIGYPINGSAWCDSYAQKGWMIGKSKMKDWRAAVRYWKANGWEPDGATATNGRPEATVNRLNLKAP